MEDKGVVTVAKIAIMKLFQRETGEDILQEFTEAQIHRAFGRLRERNQYFEPWLAKSGNLKIVKAMEEGGN
jgi:hypothetical protein